MKNKKIVNLTSHPINVLDEKFQVVKIIPPSGMVLRLPVKEEITGTICGVPVKKKEYRLEELPKKKKDTLFVVSLPVAQLSKRDDFIVPNDIIRDKDGKILGCQSFTKIV